MHNARDLSGVVGKERKQKSELHWPDSNTTIEQELGQRTTLAYSRMGGLQTDNVVTTRMKAEMMGNVEVDHKLIWDPIVSQVGMRT